MDTPQPDAVKHTKFAKLLQAVLPIAQGGLVGGFGGDSRVPGSGFRAAQNFYAQQADMAMRKQQAQMELANQKSLAAQRQETIDLDKSRETRLASQDATDQERLEQGQWKLDASVNPPVMVNARDGTIRKPKVGSTPGEVPDVPGGSSPIPDDPNIPIDMKRRLSAAGMRNGGVPDMPGGTPMGGKWRTPPDVPLVPIGQERADEAAQRSRDEEARRKEPKPRAVSDTDRRGVATTHFVDVNPESDTYMQPVNGEEPAATRYPKPSKVMAKPKVEDVEALAQEALKQESGDQAKAIDRINRAQIPDGIKSFVRQRIREIRRPGPKQNILDRYGIAAGDIGKLTQK